MTQRGHGKASFPTLSDGDGDCRSTCARTTWAKRLLPLELVDRGDFLGVARPVMRTRKGELSVQASELDFLSKALLPPPEKWHGLADVEARYRQRYVDLMVNPEVRADVRGAQPRWWPRSAASSTRAATSRSRRR